MPRARPRSPWLWSSTPAVSVSPSRTTRSLTALSCRCLHSTSEAESHDGSFYQFNLALRPDTYARVRGSIVRMNPRMALPPGRYQLRIGVRESGAGEMGSVFYDLEVPDYSARGLAMSGLLLTDGAARGQFTPQPDNELPAEVAAVARDKPPDVQSERRLESVRRDLRQRALARPPGDRGDDEPHRRRRIRRHHGPRIARRQRRAS